MKTATYPCYTAAAACAASLLASASAARAETIYGITSAGEDGLQTLVRFDSATPGAVTTIGALPAEYFALAIDFRPATGQLYVGGSRLAPGSTTEVEAQFFTADLQTAALTPVGQPFTPGGGGPIGLPSFDFNPVTDELRVVTTPTQTTGPTSVRFDPDTGALIADDAAPAFAPGDANAGLNPPAVIGIAYSNNVAGASSTTLYAYEIQSDDLATVGGPGGTPSADGGQMFTLGDSGFVVPGTADAFGFDISGPTGIAYVSSLAEGLDDGLHLFTVGLTGRMTDVGLIGTPAGTVVLDISAAVPEPVAAAPVAVAALLSLIRRKRRL